MDATGRRGPASSWGRRIVGLALTVGLVGGAAVAEAYDWPGKLSQVARGLSSASATERVSAVRGLTVFSPNDAAPLLRKALDDESSEVRVAALEGLRARGRADDVPRIIDFVTSAEEAERLAAVRALGALGDRSAVDALTRALGDPSPELREAAIRALGQLGQADAVSSVAAMLNDPEPPVVLAAIDILSASGDGTVVFALLEKTKDPNLRVQVEALAAVGRLGDPRAVKPLTGMLYVDQREVRTAVIDALGHLADREATPHLLKLMWQEHDSEIGAAVLRALGRLGDVRAIEPLLQLLRYSPAAAGAADALKLIGPPVIPAVLAVLRDPSDPVMAERCLGVLAWVARQEAGATDAQRVEITEQVVEGLAQHRVPVEAAVPVLIATRHRLGARALLDAYADLLAGVEEPEAEELRPRYEQDPDMELRRQIVAGLVDFDDVGLVTPLLELYPRMADSERGSALTLFGRFASEPAMPVLLEALRRGPGELPVLAARALGRYGTKAAGLAMVERLRTAEGPLTHELGYALGGCAQPEVTDALWTLARKSTGRRRAVALSALVDHLRVHPRRDLHDAALDALDEAPDAPLAERYVDLTTVGPVDPGTVERLMAVYDDAPVAVKLKIVQVLGDQGVSGADASLLAAARGPHASLRAEAALALGRAAPTAPETTPTLFSMLADDNDLVQINAAASLAVLASPELGQELRSRLEDVRGTARANLLVGLGRAGAAPDTRELQRLVARSRDETVARAAWRVAGLRRTPSDMAWLEAERRRTESSRSRLLLDQLVEQRTVVGGERWTRYVFADDEGPMPGQRALVTLPDGVVIARTSDRGGELRVEHPPGWCQIQPLDDAFRTGP